MEGLCQSYHWSFEQAKRLTLPQIIMMNHAAWFNHEQGKKRWEEKQKKEQKKPQGPQAFGDPCSVDFDTMTAEQVAQYVLGGDV